jgi:uncharacterized protein
MSPSVGGLQASDAVVSGPTAGQDRFELLDALRGFALFGIFLANIRFFSSWALLGDEQQRALSPTLQSWIDCLNLALIDCKFCTLDGCRFRARRVRCLRS